MKNIVIGRYIPGNSFLYKMDPRTKIISLFVLMVAVFMIPRDAFEMMFIGIGLIVLLLLIGKISIKRVYLGLRPLMFLLIFTFVFQILFNRQGPELQSWDLNYSFLNIIAAAVLVLFWIFTKKYVRTKILYFAFMLVGVIIILNQLSLGNVFSTGQLVIHEEALLIGFFIMMRLIIIVTLSTVLTLSTKPTDLNLGLEAVMKPLKFLRINTEEIAMIISISLRYIPTLLDEANKIMLAQASRGVDFAEGKLKDKVMQIISLLVPMFIISFKRSDELANAMEARCFIPGATRTRLHQLFWNRLDTVALVVSLIILIGSITVRVVV